MKDDFMLMLQLFCLALLATLAMLFVVEHGHTIVMPTVLIFSLLPLAKAIAWRKP